MRTTEKLQAKYSLILREREKHSDQTVEDFCKRHGTTPWTYYYWKKKLGKISDSSPSPRSFLPVQVMPPSPIFTSGGSSALDYELRFPNGCMMRLSGTLSREDIAAVIHTVAALRA
jgi:hypothetical protein